MTGACSQEGQHVAARLGCLQIAWSPSFCSAVVSRVLTRGLSILVVSVSAYIIIVVSIHSCVLHQLYPEFYEMRSTHHGLAPTRQCIDRQRTFGAWNIRGFGCLGALFQAQNPTQNISRWLLLPKPTPSTLQVRRLAKCCPWSVMCFSGSDASSVVSKGPCTCQYVLWTSKNI